MNFINKGDTALILAPHTDDGEFGCGGTIVKMLDFGVNVVYVAFSAAELSVPSHLPKNILRTEVLDATAELGIPEENCIVLDFMVRTFPENRQNILEEMVTLNATYKPKVVFLPSTKDLHQDHSTVSNEGFRAFKKTTILGYEMPWNNIEFGANCFIELGEREVRKKVSAISKYQSQQGKPYATGEFIRSLAVTRGCQIGKSFAETFEVIRCVFENEDVNAGQRPVGYRANPESRTPEKEIAKDELLTQ